jgi:hypothetical protein
MEIVGLADPHDAVVGVGLDLAIGIELRLIVVDPIELGISVGERTGRVLGEFVEVV